MVISCDYSREERHCCRPSHSYRFVVGNMLILVGIISEERSLSDKFIIGRATVGIIARLAVCTVRAIDKPLNVSIRHSAVGQLADERMLSQHREAFVPQHRRKAVRAYRRCRACFR